MEHEGKACCFSGDKIEKLACSEKHLEELLMDTVNRAIEDGFDTFYHGCSMGADLIAAERVLLRRFMIKKGDPEHIRLIGVMPYEEQASRWNSQWRDRYFDILEKCDDVIMLHTTYAPGCYQERNRYMVDRCQRLIAVCGGVPHGGTKSAILYAQRKNIEVCCIAP